jgi:glucuronate isomerase
MAGTTTKSKQQFKPGTDAGDLVVQFNNLVTAFDAVLAKLDADGGVTDTNYTSLHGSTASKIGNMAGTAFSSTTY